jgi:NAD(P)H-nitrite reductase large subunit
VIICRCEEIDREAIVEAYEAGYRSVEEIKRKLRCGMGPCQGRTCTSLILGLLAELSGRAVAEIAPPVRRPPLKPVALGLFAALEGGAGHEARH